MEVDDQMTPSTKQRKPRLVRTLLILYTTCTVLSENELFTRGNVCWRTGNMSRAPSLLNVIFLYD